ncbi:MAG: type IV pilus assembly protein PilM [Planctomycetota bacterium]
MKRREKRVLGLDIGSHSIRALEVTRDKKDFVITGYGHVEVSSEATVPEAIRELLAHHRFRARKVVSSVSGKSVIVRYIDILKMDDSSLKNAIKFELEKYIPFDVDEVVYDCQRLEGDWSDGERSSEEMKVLLVAVKRSLIEDHVAVLQAANLQPYVVDTEAFALGNAFELNSSLSSWGDGQEKVIALVDIGGNKTNINILKGATSCFTREVYMGGEDFTSAIARKLCIEQYEAEILKRDPKDSYEDVREAVLPCLDDLGSEINLSFEYFENQFERPVDEVYISGGGSRLVFLEEAFEKIFEKTIKTWNPLEGLKVKAESVDLSSLNEHAPQLAVSVGLAARMTQRD